MTRPATDSDLGTRSRRSTRTRSQPAIADKKVKATASKSSSIGPKSREDVIDSEDDDIEEQENEEEEEEEEEEVLTRKSRRATTAPTAAITATTAQETRRSGRSAPTRLSARLPAQSAKQPTTRPAPAQKKTAAKNGKSAPPKKTAKTAAPIDIESGEDAENDQTSDEDEYDKDDDNHEPSSDDADDSGSDFEQPAGTKKNARSPASKKAGQANIPVIRQKKSGASSKTPKSARTSKSSSARKPTASTDDQENGVEGEEGQSDLYAAVLDSQVALDTVVAEWIRSYERSAEEALLDLTNFLIRSCGCTQFVSADEFDDDDNMLETLQDILVRYKENTSNFDYPIVSKAKEYKKFKKNLLEFYTRLIQKTQGEILFDGVFMESVLTWTISLSSTTFRPFRHTAAVVALNLVTSLAEIASETQEELNVTNRQLATNQKQKATATKIKQLEKKVAEGLARKAQVLKWIDEIFVSVYVLRWRDVDPLVRSDCVRELGQWMIAYQEHFVASSYLKYLGFVLSDKVAAVRLESLKVLAKLYEIENQPTALRQFTNRFTDRYIEMAIGESDTSARLGAIKVATLVHRHGQLEEEDLVKLSALIFGANTKVRKGMAKFVKARVWEDEVEGRMAAGEIVTSSSKDSTELKKDWIELKSLASFLIKVGKTVEEQNETTTLNDSQTDKTGTRLFEETKVGRIALAVEALWSEIDSLKNWNSIADYLTKDHSTVPVASSSSQRGTHAAKSLEELYSLDEEEENVLLEILIASLQMILHPPAAPGFHKDKAKLKAQQDEVSNEVGRFCVGLLPQLFLKYGIDAVRVRSVLVIPQLIPLNVYLDMRMLAAYEDLVDEVVKVFKKHTEPSVLHTAAVTIRAFQGYEVLKTSHEAKIEALGASLLESFLNLVATEEDMAERDALEEMTLALRRLEHLVKCTDVTSKTPRGSTQNPYDGLLKVVGRYKTAQGPDAELTISALSISFLWISWVCRDNASKNGQDADWTADDAQELLKMRDALVRTISGLTDRDNQDVDARLRRKAFQVLGDIYWLFGGDMFHSSKGVNRHSLYMTCPEATQAECESFVRSELDLWGEKVQEKAKALREARTPKAGTGEKGADASPDSDDDGAEKDSENEELLEDENLAAALIEQEDKYEMFGTVFSFMRQIILKDFSMEHATAVVAHYGRFGAEFDEGVKRVVTALKAQTTSGASRLANQKNTEVFMSVCMASLKQAFELFVDGHTRSTNQALHLAKVLITAIKPPGFMQNVRSGIDARLVWNMQRQGINHAIEKIASYEQLDDQVKKAKMAKFFDILGQLLFGIQTRTAEVTAMQELVQSKCDENSLTVDDDSVWESLQQYQAKLEKLLQKAMAEQATSAKKAEDAARLREEQQQQRDQAAEAQEQRLEESEIRDVDMEADTANHNVDAAAAPTVATTAADYESVPEPEKVAGKKRLATPEEDEDTEGDRDGMKHSRSVDADEQASDNESRSSEQGVSVNETKRLRVR
ncbi:hypothetical protein BGZ96_001569 [Linnemannia gamsii]|uniref:SCD domain-containing protein n=1 Tax=Linnemannia gamsii TaxID=64522 RepID=A0ABQ7JM17_9FUNG|nr:hypothetical protein BGZ96_001569 [Linnemannia gamsii]